MASEHGNTSEDHGTTGKRKTLVEVAGMNDTTGGSSASSDKTGQGISSETSYRGNWDKEKDLRDVQHPLEQDSTHGGDAMDTGADNQQVP